MKPNPANDPNYIFNLADKMESNPKLRAAIHALFRKGDLSFLLHDTQLKIRNMIMNSDKPEYFIECSRQLGKSFVVIVIALETAIKNQKKPVRVFAHTEAQVSDIVEDNLRVIQSLSPKGFIQRKKSDKRWQIGKAGEIRIGPLAQAHVDGKRGGNAILAILEEGGFTPSEEYVSAIGSVINPQLLRSQGKLIHVSSTSKDPDHYLHTEVSPKCERLGTKASYTIYDNPQLTPTQIETAKERCPTEDDWKREYLNTVVRDKISTVIPEFEKDEHVKEMEPPSHTYWQTVIDFGGTLDKHGLLLTYYDFERAKLCVYDERFYSKNTPTGDIVEGALDMESYIDQKSHWIGGHPRRVSDCPGQILIDLRNDYKFNARTPEKAKGSWEAGITGLRLAFQRGDVEIHPRCKDLIAQLQYGRYTKNRKDFLRTESMGHLDLLSALIYGLRHKCTINPFPKHLGKHRHIHHLADKEQENTLIRIIRGT